MLEDIKAVGMDVAPETEEYLMSLTSEEAFREFQNANVDHVLKPTELLANSKVSELMCRQLNLPAIMMTMHLYTIGHARKFMEHAQRLAEGLDENGKKFENGIYTVDHQLGAVRMGLVGADMMSKIVARASKQAQTAQPEKLPRRPKNSPPDSGGVPATLIQNNIENAVINNP